MIDHTHYTYRVTWSEEDGEHLALCAEFPSLSFLSGTPSKALQGMVKMIGDIVEDMDGSGEKIPTPIAARKYSGKFQVRIPPQQHKNLALQAAEEGTSLNRYVSMKLAG